MFLDNLMMYKHLVFILLTLGRCLGRGDGWNQPHVEDALEMLCPYNTLCRAEAPRLVSDNDDLIGCCSDCSCDETCGLTESCCLPEMDIHKVVDRSHQHCLMPITLQDVSLELQSYNMVVDSYPDGKGDDCGDDVTPCGDDESASPIGALYPVFSSKTGRIYKNIKCAKCHGLKDEDLIKWEVLLQCDTILLENFNTLFVDVSAAFNSLENLKPASNCHYVFYYPGTSSDVKSEECFGERKFTCLESFYVDSRLNMTETKIRSICHSGLRSSQYSMFVHTFCYICSNQNSEIIDYPFLCQKEKETSIKGLADSAFSALIVPEMLEMTRLDISEKSKETSMACSDDHILTNTTKVLEDCRAIACPTGRLRKHDETCVFPTKRLNNNFLTLKLHLKPNSVIYDSGMIENETLALFAIETPWFPAWKITTIFKESSPDRRSSTSIKSFFISMSYIKKHTSISKVLSDIEKTLEQPWYITLNHTKIGLTQTHFRYDRLFEVTNGIFTPVPFHNGQTQLTTNLTIVNHPVFTTLYKSGSIRRDISITKTFFCDQIELTYDEFEMYLEFGIFYHKLQKRIFYQGEFSYVFDDNGDVIPRICIEDSNFKRKDSSNKSSKVGISKALFVSCVFTCLLKYLDLFSNEI